MVNNYKNKKTNKTKKIGEKSQVDTSMTVFDYKDVKSLKDFLHTNGRILPRKKTGLSAKGQRNLANAIKRARFMGLLPYIAR